MEWVRRIFRAVGPVVVGACLLAFPLLFAPEPAQANTGDCAGYDTVECSTLEWCIGVKWFGFGLCMTNYSYWPAVSVILQESMGDYIHGSGGGGAF